MVANAREKGAQTGSRRSSRLHLRDANEQQRVQVLRLRAQAAVAASVYRDWAWVRQAYDSPIASSG
jgi:hypothetical protein